MGLPEYLSSKIALPDEHFAAASVNPFPTPAIARARCGSSRSYLAGKPRQQRHFGPGNRFPKPRLARDSNGWKFFPISSLSYRLSNATLDYGTSPYTSVLHSTQSFRASPALSSTYLVFQELPP